MTIRRLLYCEQCHKHTMHEIIPKGLWEYFKCLVCGHTTPFKTGRTK